MKIDHLSLVSKTLFVSLLARAEFSLRKKSFLKDKLALAVAKEIMPTRELKALTIDSAPYFPARAWQFERLIRQFCCANPNAVIVNLGAGLDTTYYRLKNKRITWIDIDLPAVIRLRKRLFPQSKKIISLTSSIDDFTWMKKIKRFDGPFLFVASGLFMYLEKSLVKKLIIRLAEEFSGSECIFDAISKAELNRLNEKFVEIFHPPIMRSFIARENEVSSISSKIELVTCSVFAKLKNRSAYLRDEKCWIDACETKKVHRLYHLKFKIDNLSSKRRKVLCKNKC